MSVFKPAGVLRRRTVTLGGSLALVVTALVMPAQVSAAAPTVDECDLSEEETLTVEDLPEGSSVIECEAVGLVIRQGDVGLTVPAPGEAAGVELISDGESDGFQIEVAADGTVNYPEETPGPQSGGGDISIAADPGACSDGAYSTNDLKEYGTYNWYVGDGGMPGALTKDEARAAFADAINNITGSYNNCDYTDTVDAKSQYQGTTTYEADMNASGSCTSRDGQSTWDAGDLPSDTVAQACWWSVATPGIKNDLLESDVRYNTTDKNFTDNGASSSCSNKYDVRSVGTHEAGHVFGMGHVGSGHNNLTMYTNSFLCETKARTLGKGDVLGLRSIY
ncbi:hypothetical protein Kisp01_71330 [Kineosporia sp. NBRC 101677]|nr:hypothetical protein Kisp01_71330 [Kineosporia sp. NBRC 101677]